MDKDFEIENLKKALHRAKLARVEAESFMESKSLELYNSNSKLIQLNESLEEEVKKRTKKIEEKEKRFKALVENATDIIFTINLNGLFTYVNPVAENISGFSKDELLLMKFWELIKPNHKDRVIKHYNRQLIKLEEISVIEFPITNSNQETIWISQKARLIQDENGAKEFVAISRDVTETKLANETVRRSEEKYRGIIENLELGILEVDNNDKIIKAYPQFCKLSGYREDELLGNSPLELFLDEDSKEIMLGQNEARRKGISSVYEVALRKKNGEIAWVLISGAPYYNQKGKLEGSVGIHLDITDRKRIEEELRSAKLRAEKMNDTKELFLANISHEIRTPMNAIVGMAELLENSALTETQNNYVAAIQSSSNNLLILINDLLDFSKIDSGNISLEMVPFKVKDVVQNTLEILKLKAEENVVKLITEIDNKIPNVMIGDPVRLGQVMINLVGNAVKFTSNAKVTIKVILIEKRKSNFKLKFSVIDEGIGISSDELDYIFEDFSQAKDSTNRLYGGTGLGLSISKKLVTIMGSELKVKSELHKGSEFYFSISLKESLEKIDKPENHNDFLIDDFKRARVLLVEDHSINILLAKTILEAWNIVVDTAEHGIDAIKMIKENNYSLILMDMRMPKMGGVEATRIIRDQLKNTTPILAMTGNAVLGDREKCIESGMNDYLSKPFSQHDLNKKLSKFIKIKNLRIEEELLYDLTRLKKMGDELFVQKMVNLFLTEITRDISEMIDCLEEKQFNELRDLAHKIKPSINHICVNAIYLLNLEIENWNEEDDIMINKTHYFANQVNSVLAQLKENNLFPN